MFKKYDAERSAYWCVVAGDRLRLVNGQIPFGLASELGMPTDKAMCIGEYQGAAFIWVNDADCEQEQELHSLRTCLDFETDLFLLASKAVQYGNMQQTLRFCSQCGARNTLNHEQLAMQCGECRQLHYPRISPCIIVAIRKHEQILLAQHNHHKSGVHTVIAGFVEVGETLEQCVSREVKEETGIDIANIRYFSSQPWAFPSNLMVAFLADYRAGEVVVDTSELKSAAWFSPEELPYIPPPGTIARELIEHTINDIQST